MLEKLSSGLRSCIERLTRTTLVDKEVVDEMLRDIQRTLLSGDVDVKLVFELCEKIRKRAFEQIPKGLTRKEHVIKILYEEITNIMGKEPEIGMPKRILLVGLFGSGKTTVAAKLARFYQKKGLKPLLVCCDTFRPAAYEQLEQLAKKINVPFYGDEKIKEPHKIINQCNLKNYDIVIVDSSGRDALNNDMIKEIKDISNALNPDEKILVIPADIGQAASQQARAFQDALNITGVIVTKLDATAKGGGALTACAASGATVKFIGTGEKLGDLEVYDPKRFVSRLMGFGDLESLLEKAKEVVKPDIAEKIIGEKFDMNDFCEQIESMQKVGTMDKILDMMGLSGAKIPKDVLGVQEEKMKKWKHIVNSMTKQERSEPDIINASRIARIARGSGSSEADVRELVASYKKVRKMIRMLKPGKFRGLKLGMKGFEKLLKNFRM
ncbi:MAG: signal recognition particle protein [Candidatus Aenigmarchaeota archaeon]|nr:signal recognition particle protein [Candidatus Aenigmarchaeota archaeon]